jgi:hypothetical protein
MNSLIHESGICQTSSRPNFLCTQIDLHDLINDSAEPYFLFIIQQITTFLSMKISGKINSPLPTARQAKNHHRFPRTSH